MLPGARMLFASGKWKNPYVTDGLVAMWDGEWNAGPGVHDASATEWKSVVANAPSLILSGFSFNWDNNSLVSLGDMNDPYNNNGKCPYTSASMTFGENFTIEVVVNTTKGLRRWNSKPWSGNFESWYSDAYIERIYDTRLSVVSGSWTGRRFVTMKEGRKHIFSIDYADGQTKSATGTISRDYSYTGAMYFAGPIPADGHIFAVRIYSRALTASEVAANYAIDQMRFNIA